LDYYLTVCLQLGEAIQLRAQADAALSEHRQADAANAYIKLYNLQGYDCIDRDKLLAVLHGYAVSLRSQPQAARKQLYQILSIDEAYTKSREHLDTIVESIGMNPKSFNDRLTLARSAAQDGQFEMAIGEYREALRLKSDEPVQSELWDLLTQNNLEKQLSSWRDFLKAHPGTAQGHLGLGETLVKLKQPDEARLEFQRALDIDPTCETAKQYLKETPNLTGTPDASFLRRPIFRQW